MPFHSTYTGDDIHTPVSFEYANEAARLADTSRAASDLYKFARQVDNDSLWMLVATDPTWVQVGIGTSDISTTIYNGDATISGNRTLTMSGNLNFNPDTDGSYTVDFGPSLSSRIDSFDTYTDSSATINAGETNDRSYLAMFGTAIKGLELGYLLNETTFMGVRVNYIDSGNIEIVDAVNSTGARYAADYSANFVDRSLVDKAWVEGQISGSNIYEADGTLSGNRQVDLNSNQLDLIDNATATAATGSITFSSVPANGDTTTIDGKEIRWVNTLDEFSGNSEIARGSLTTGTEAATVFEAFLNASEPGDGIQFWKRDTFPVTPSRNSAIVTVTSTILGEAGNDITTTATGSDMSWGSGTLTGGEDVDVLVFSPTQIEMHREVYCYDDAVWDFGRHVSFRVTSFPNDLWELDASGGAQNLNFSYNTNGTPVNKIQFAENGNLIMTDGGDVQIPGGATTADYWLIGTTTTDAIEFRYFDQSAGTFSTQMTIGSGGGNVTFNQNLILGTGGNQLRLPTDSTANDQWRIDGGNSDDDLHIAYYDDSGSGATALFTVTPSGLLNYESDQSANYTARSLVDKDYVDNNGGTGNHDMFPYAANKVGGSLSPIPANAANRATLPLNNEYLADSNNYSLASNQITFLNTGIYKISLDLTLSELNQTGSTRGIATVTAFQGGGSGTGSAIHVQVGYVREQVAGMGLSMNFFIAITTANDTLEFDIFMEDDTFSALPPQFSQDITMVTVLKVANV